MSCASLVKYWLIMFFVLVSTRMVSGQYATPPSTPVLDAMGVDTRGKLMELDQRQAQMESELWMLRQRVGILGDAMSSNQTEINSRVGKQEKLVEQFIQEMKASRDSPPLWLKEMLTRQEAAMAALRKDLDSTRNTSKPPLPTVKPNVVFNLPMHLHLSCGCPAELLQDSDGVWKLTERHRSGKIVRRELSESNTIRKGWSVLAKTSGGYELVTDSSGSSFEIIAAR
jgi:hypothetical protein